MLCTPPEKIEILYVKYEEKDRYPMEIKVPPSRLDEQGGISYSLVSELCKYELPELRLDTSTVKYYSKETNSYLTLSPGQVIHSRCPQQNSLDIVIEKKRREGYNLNRKEEQELLLSFVREVSEERSERQHDQRGAAGRASEENRGETHKLEKHPRPYSRSQIE